MSKLKRKHLSIYFFPSSHKGSMTLSCLCAARRIIHVSFSGHLRCTLLTNRVIEGLIVHRCYWPMSGYSNSEISLRMTDLVYCKARHDSTGCDKSLKSRKVPIMLVWMRCANRTTWCQCGEGPQPPRLPQPAYPTLYIYPISLSCLLILAQVRNMLGR